MVPGSRCMRSNTCGCRTYHWAVMMPRINTRSDCVLQQWHPIPSHQLWEWCVTVKKGRIEAFTSVSPNMNTIVIIAKIVSRFVVKDDLVQFRCSPVSSCVVLLQTEALMRGRHGQHT
ncbi:hypothetical protein TNCV_3761361 [Trichonephila clavipes]|nr:hypothetical protein TNCV_3761361 [Trichonephila clavipes]